MKGLLLSVIMVLRLCLKKKTHLFEIFNYMLYIDKLSIIGETKKIEKIMKGIQHI